MRPPALVGSGLDRYVRDDSDEPLRLAQCPWRRQSRLACDVGTEFVGGGQCLGQLVEHPLEMIPSARSGLVRQQIPPEEILVALDRRPDARQRVEPIQVVGDLGGAQGLVDAGWDWSRRQVGKLCEPAENPGSGLVKWLADDVHRRGIYG